MRGVAHRSTPALHGLSGCLGDLSWLGCQRFSVFKNFYWSVLATMLYSFLLYSKVTQLSVYIHPFFCIFPSHSRSPQTVEFPVLHSRFPISYLEVYPIPTCPWRCQGGGRETGRRCRVSCSVRPRTSSLTSSLWTDPERKEWKKESFF